MNSILFSEKDCKKGLHLKFIEQLTNLSMTMDEDYLQILIEPSCDGIEVFFNQCMKDDENEINSYYKLVGSDEYVMHRYYLPDNHYEYVENKEQEDEFLQYFLEDHPNYVKDERTGRYVPKEELGE